MESGTVIWVDLQGANAPGNLSAQLSLFCPIYKIRGVDKAADAIRAFSPRTVFFEYDAPNAELLEPLKRLASDFPALRFVMITQEHSESLAVWALRARIWDYIVKPVDLSYLLSCVDAHTSRDGGTTSVGEVKNSRFEQEPRSDGPNVSNFSNRPHVGNDHGAGQCLNKLTPALIFVKANYAEKVTLGAAAELCGLGRYQFSRAFKQAHGTTFREFVIIHRIQKAEQMLGIANLSITNVAFSVGFNDLSHFAEMFRRYVGVRPSEYVEWTKRNAGPTHISRTTRDATQNYRSAVQKNPSFC